MSLPPAKIAWDGLEREPKKLAIGLMLDAGFGLPVDAEVHEAVTAAASLFAEAGARVREVKPFITREIFDAGKPVAFICHAGWVPISAGIVRGKRGTSVGAIKDDLVNAGMLWEDSPVVVDGNLISSRTPADLPAFMKALIGALQ